MGSSAVILAASTVLAWSVLTVGVRATLYGFGFEPWTLAMAIQFFAGASLLSAAGLASLPTAQLRRWATWAIGGLRVLTTCAFSAALLHASAGQVSLLCSVNMLLGAIGVFLVFGRKPRRVETVGFALIALGLALLDFRLDGGWSNPAIGLTLFSESSVVAASLLAERHPDNLGSHRQRLALTGFVTLFSASGLLIVWSVLGRVVPEVAIGPSAADVLATLSSPLLWGCALVFGVLFRAPLTYMAFQMMRLVGADGYMLSMAALPITTLLFEIAASEAGLLPPPKLDPVTLGYSAVILAGGAWIILVRVRRR